MMMMICVLEQRFPIKSPHRFTHQLNSVHPLSADPVTQPSERQLSEESTDRVSDLDTEILVGGVGATCVVNVTDHGGGDGNGEDIVGIGEETDTGNDTGLGVEELGWLAGCPDRIERERKGQSKLRMVLLIVNVTWID